MGKHRRHLLFSLSLHLGIFLGVGVIWNLSRPTPALGDIKHPIIATFLYEDKINKLSLAKQKTDIDNAQQPIKTLVLTKKGSEKKQASLSQASAQHSQHSQGEHQESLVTLLHAAIQAEQRYPAAAEQMQRQGTATVAFVLYTDGHVSDLKIVQSSGTNSLDEAALAAVNRAAPFKQVDKYLSQSQHYTIDVIFQLA